MNLVFKEYLKFLEDKGIDILAHDLKEGYYWLDNQIIKAYDKQGNIHKVIRLAIDDTLNMTIKTVYKDKPFEIESWYQTIKRNKNKLEELETESKELIKNMLNKYPNYIPNILTSTGKDSMLVWYLVNQVNNNTEAIFTNTSLDCADTYKFVKTFKNTTIISPKEGFYQFQKRLNFIPTRMYRACCDIFKEDSMIKQTSTDEKYLFFMGMRNEESNTRSGYIDEWKSKKWGNREWQGVLPIRKWTEEDVWLYTLLNEIPINPKYKKGYSRIGCAIACPFYTKSTWILDKYWYPEMYKRWHKILDDDFTKNNKALVMNCTKEEYKLKSWNGTILRSKPTEEVINEFAEMNKINKDIAEKYFNHTCECCGKKIRFKEVLAMNMKYFGRNTQKFYCKKHLMETLSEMYNKPFTKEDWIYNAQRFKDQGCALF